MGFRGVDALGYRADPVGYSSELSESGAQVSNAKWAWMQTRSGKKIDLLDPDPSQILIEDIAYALASINRFAGHTRWSVASHSVLVSLLCPVEKKWGFLHDAHEAFMGDVTSPVKCALKALGAGDAIEVLDMKLQRAVAIRFGLEYSPTRGLPAEVHLADLQALAIERRDLLSPPPEPWHPVCEAVKALEWPTLRVYTASDSEEAFLARAVELGIK